MGPDPARAAGARGPPGTRVMKPESFKQANGTLLGGPAADYGTSADVADLPVWRGDGQIISCWRLGWIERLKLLVFGRVWLRVSATRTHAPVCLEAESPWR